MLSSNAFLARILASENAEILGSVDSGVAIFAAGVAVGKVICDFIAIAGATGFSTFTLSGVFTLLLVSVIE